MQLVGDRDAMHWAEAHQAAPPCHSRIIETAKRDLIVSSLYEPTTVATLFAPTDRGIHNTIKQLMRINGVTLSTLLTDPVAAAKFVQVRSLCSDDVDSPRPP